MADPVVVAVAIAGRAPRKASDPAWPVTPSAQNADLKRARRGAVDTAARRLHAAR